MSSKDVVTRPFDAKCLISMGKNLSFSSLLPSVEKPNHLYRSEEDKVDFRLLTDSLATAPDKTFVVLVCPQEHYFAIFESGNMAFSSFPA